jgi:Ni,Fe-hydrogenase III large subunit
MSTRTCEDNQCGQEAVAFVAFQSIDIDRDERGHYQRVVEVELDLCGEHMLDLERDVEAGEAFIIEQNDYVHGDVWRRELEEV